MFPDFKELLSAFNAHSVKYLIIGGYAVSFDAQLRATKDLDVFIKADPANTRATYAALVSSALHWRAFGLRTSPTRRNSSASASPRLRWTFCREIDGVDFDGAWERRTEGVTDSDSGLIAFFISKEDLIASKIAAGRLRDLADVEEIREAQSSQQDRENDC